MSSNNTEKIWGDFSNAVTIEGEAFNIEAVTTFEYYKRSSSVKSSGPDGLQMEVLRIPRVTEKVTRFMNEVFNGVAPSEWTTAHVVAILNWAPELRTTKKEDHRSIYLQCETVVFCYPWVWVGNFDFDWHSTSSAC